MIIYERCFKMYYNKEIFPTMITPYKNDGSIDYDTVIKYVDWYFSKGCTGIFAVCQSSEIFFLSLEERIKINALVYKRAKELEKNSGRRFTVVSSGHVSDDLDSQAEELNAIAESGTDALIFITNRFDINQEGDKTFIKNAEYVMSKLPNDIPLGFYECPKPYKRLVSDEILNWCIGTKRFKYMKDTCCDDALIAKRLEILKDSGFNLLNANSQTLLSSLKNGCMGYCGVMANLHPELYVWLCRNFEKEPEKAEALQGALGSLAFAEGGLPYPLFAKYHMCLEGIPTEDIARSRKGECMSDYQKDCTRQMRDFTSYTYKSLLSSK